MQHYRAILKQVGIVSIGLGILDLMYMVYRVSTHLSQSPDGSYSSPGILIVVAGRNVSIPKQAFFLGVGVTVLLPVLQYIQGDGVLVMKAVDLARAKYGAGYRYHVTALNRSRSRSRETVSANIAAYNDKEIKTVRVELK